MPTIDCSLQPAPVKKGKRKTAIAIAAASFLLMIRAFLSAGQGPEAPPEVLPNDSRDPIIKGK